jgi:hypothetical protein
MKLFAVMKPLFDALSDGKIIRRSTAWVLRFVAVLSMILALLGVVCVIGFGARLSQSELGEHAIAAALSCIFLAIILLILGFLCAGILVFRARSIEELEEGRFTVLPMISLLLRLNGELIFVTYAFLGIGGCIFVWFALPTPFAALGALSEAVPFAPSPRSGFLGGIELAALLMLVAFAGIVINYAFSEMTMVLVEIASNTRALRTPVQRVNTPSPTGIDTIDHETELVEHCHRCGQPLEADSAFCAECGTRVK